MKSRTIRTKWVLFFLVFPILLGCKSSIEPQASPIVLSRSSVADVFGNHDGTTTAEELAALDSYFAATSEAWCVSGFPMDDSVSGQIAADKVVSHFLGMATKPYPTELALREAYNGLSVKTPYVAIVVLRQTSEVHLIKFFRSPGPKLSEAVWDPLNVSI